MEGGFFSHVAGRAEPRFRGKDNFVVVKHDDGTLGTYCHLLKAGVKVQVHQRIQAGDVIGLSGNSGYTSGPHLHFHVARCATLGSSSCAFPRPSQLIHRPDPNVYREVDPQMFIQIPGIFTGGDDQRFICDKAAPQSPMDAARDPAILAPARQSLTRATPFPVFR